MVISCNFISFHPSPYCIARVNQRAAKRAWAKWLGPPKEAHETRWPKFLQISAAKNDLKKTANMEIEQAKLGKKTWDFTVGSHLKIKSHILQYNEHRP